MKKVYLVTAGEYSDYHLEHAFTTRELAEAFIEREKLSEKYSFQRRDVEEYVLWNELPPRVALTVATGELQADGSITDITYRTSDQIEDDQQPEEHHQRSGFPFTISVMNLRSREAAEHALRDLGTRLYMSRRADLNAPNA